MACSKVILSRTASTSALSSLFNLSLHSGPIQSLHSICYCLHYVIQLNEVLVKTTHTYNALSHSSTHSQFYIYATSCWPIICICTAVYSHVRERTLCILHSQFFSQTEHDFQQTELCTLKARSRWQETPCGRVGNVKYHYIILFACISALQCWSMQGKRHNCTNTQKEFYHRSVYFSNSKDHIMGYS